MTAFLFIFAITSYLLSVVAAITLSFLHNRVSQNFGKIILFLNVVVGAVWLILFLNDKIFSEFINYLFVLYFCTGVVTSGYWLWVKSSYLLKIYCLIFISSVAIFVISPSRVIGFIATADIKTIDPERWQITGNYFLVEQNGIFELATGETGYKIIREMGFFHKTIARDLQIRFIPYGTELIEIQPDSMLKFRVYNDQDDELIAVELSHKNKSGVITRKPNGN